MGWKQGEAAAERAGSGMFVKLENDGDSFVGAFWWCGQEDTDDPYVEDVIWNEKLDQMESYTTAHKEAGKKPSSKFYFSVYVTHENGEKLPEATVKVFNCNIGTFKNVLIARDKYGCDKWLFEVKRHGKKGDQKTKYTVLPEDKMSDDMRKAIVVAQRHDLKKVAAGDFGDVQKKETTKSSAASSSSSNGNGNGSCISDKLQQELVAKLKELPREHVQKFLAKFGVTKVKDVKSSDSDAAKNFVLELANPTPAANATPKEVDPFAPE